MCDVNVRYGVFFCCLVGIVINKLESCIVLNEHSIVFAQSGPLYGTSVSLGPPESSMQTASRLLQPLRTAQGIERL